MRWADRHGVFRSEGQRRLFAAMNIGDLAGRMHPEGGFEDLCLLTDWVAWLFLRDDRWKPTDSLEEWERLAERDRAYLRVMRQFPQRAPGDEEDGLAGALSDLCSRLRARARKNGLANPIDGNFTSWMKSFFFSNVREAFYQRRGECPPLADYIEMRRTTGGLDILTKILGAMCGIRIPAEFLSRPEVQRLTESSHDVCCWHNDLISFDKEFHDGEVNNLVLVLLQDFQSGCGSLTEAVDLAARMIRDELGTFVELGHGILETAGERHADVAEWYVRMLSHRISGILSWEEHCVARYRKLSIASS
ncbi:MAG: terpene synthase family protein [Rubrobacteraceae bacterium]